MWVSVAIFDLRSSWRDPVSLEIIQWILLRERLWTACRVSSDISCSNRSRENSFLSPKMIVDPRKQEISSKNWLDRWWRCCLCFVSSTCHCSLSKPDIDQFGSRSNSYRQLQVMQGETKREWMAEFGFRGHFVADMNVANRQDEILHQL